MPLRVVVGGEGDEERLKKFGGGEDGKWEGDGLIYRLGGE